MLLVLSHCGSFSRSLNIRVNTIIRTLPRITYNPSFFFAWIPSLCSVCTQFLGLLFYLWHVQVQRRRRRQEKPRENTFASREQMWPCALGGGGGWHSVSLMHLSITASLTNRRSLKAHICSYVVLFSPPPHPNHKIIRLSCFSCSRLHILICVFP